MFSKKKKKEKNKNQWKIMMIKERTKIENNFYKIRKGSIHVTYYTIVYKILFP